MIAIRGEALVKRADFTVHPRLTRARNNPPMLKTLVTALVVLAAVVLGGFAWIWSRPASPKPFIEAYQQALERLPGSEAGIQSGLEAFQRVYGDLTHARIDARIRDLYADPLYFNDSLKTFTSRPELVDYMRATGAMLESSEVHIDRVLRDGTDVFVRWTMHFRASAMGRPVDSASIGMSHLRFDADGRIVLHQDFWDSAAGLYRNLPVVGYALDKVDARMVAGGD